MVLLNFLFKFLFTVGSILHIYHKLSKKKADI